MSVFTLPSVGWIKGVSITGATGIRHLAVDTPIEVVPGDTILVTPKTGRIRIVRYEDALLEPEWEIFQ